MKNDTLCVWIVILIIPITIFFCVLNSIEERKIQDQEWQAHHDKYKWGDPPMPHGDDTNSVMNPYGTNDWGK